MGEFVKIWGPASLSNLGPGFDSVGLAITGYGDVLEARLDDESGVRVEAITGDGGTLSLVPEENTVAVAAKTLLDQAGSTKGITFRIHKGIPLGSGIGGSSASAVAGAMAANVLLGNPFPKTELIEAVLTGEVVASGGRHGDNVLPALLGGLVLVSSSDPTRFHKIHLPKPLHIAVIVPQVRVLTKEARAMLHNLVPFRDAIHNASDFAFLSAAFVEGDWESVGKFIMRDRLVEPIRARLVPVYDEVKHAALTEGKALGCALTGSGPAMFAVCESQEHAEACVAIMQAASIEKGIPAIGKAVQADQEGTRAIVE
jgi:homoserine kinase